MLKRLRIKFVIVIMSIVTVIFGTVFGFIVHFTKQNIERESVQMMRGMVFRPPGMFPFSKPDDMPDNIRLPFFTLSIAENGEVTASGTEYFDLTDQAMLEELADSALNASGETGLIVKYDLRYMRAENGDTVKIVFADATAEKAMLKGMIQNFIIGGLIGYLVFFGISLVLAKWVTRPVEKTWNEQKQFIADASHELKTPLTVIMTNAEMLGDQSYSANDKNQFIKNILATSKRMRGLVESLLELARLDNNKAQMERTGIDLSKLLNDSILLFEPLFYENDLILQTEIEDHVTTVGNADKLRQVVTVLLDNALKYSSSAGNVTVALKRQSIGCLLTVSGTGAPLSREDCKNIFKRFYRVDQSRNDGQSYGLGLSIAESIVREHNGRIWAESENGRNTFYVVLLA